jgi:sugar phosphate isomerase/epimerase
VRESIHKYFQVGIVSFMAYPANLKGNDAKVVEQIEKIVSDDYFDAIEVNWIKDEGLRRQASKLLAASHMKVCFGAQPQLLTTGLNPNDLDEVKRKEAEAMLFLAIDYAEELGANGIAFLAGKWEEETKEQSYAQLLKTTTRVCAYAKLKGMFVELEVFDYDIAKASLIGPAPLAARFAAEMRTSCSNFGLLIDLSHIPMTHESSVFVIQMLKPYLTHFHIGNTVCLDKQATGYGDEHQRFGFPCGSNDVNEVLDFLRALKQEGFFKPETPYVLSFEVKPWKDENTAVVIANAKRVLNRAWALLED